MLKLRRILCLLGFHDPKIIRRVYWGRCYHAELRCKCGRRFEGFAIDSATLDVGFLRKEPFPTDFWQMYDSGTVPAVIYRNGYPYYVGRPYELP